MRSITLGHYLPGNSLLHKLDPRVKLLSLLILIVALFLVKTFLGFLLFAAFMLIIFASSRLPWRYFLRGLRPILYIVLFTLILHFLFTEGGQVYWRWGPITIEEAGVYLGAFMTLRLVLLVITTLLVTLTTSPIAFADGIEFLLRPFRRLGIPGHEIAMMMTIALRFIPTLIEESDKIRKAQMARGADFETGNILRRARNLVPLLVPLFVSAFRRADELAVAMEARCYRGGENRTKLRELHTRPLDYFGIITVTGLVLAIVLTGV
ncbi:MAG: energy-coupling factor transporter transmembrane protein EcfT [Dethiobacter sp.]|jgi:energy-coupling factor transport system permease protein|nr:MAG: energy-coupling factor transporter transmembrane protein EcfT [Dethiobacter sp.]